MKMFKLFVILTVLLIYVECISCSVKWNSTINRLLVDSEPFQVRGIVYSPIPIGDSPGFLPMGDYFTLDYAYLWKRDLPAIKAMGANTVRVYGFLPTNNHTDFLDTLHYYGLKVIISYGLGGVWNTPVLTAQQRQSHIDKFIDNVKFYGNHPAILMWIFGNEINGVWNGYLKQFSDVNNCGWTELECYNLYPASCILKSACVYNGFFGWLNAAAAEAKKYVDIPVATGFADVDYLLSYDGVTPGKLKLYADVLSDVDIYVFHVYRGKSFGTFFDEFTDAAVGKAVIIGEYGIDAYNDPCGWPENYDTWQPCRNTLNDGLGGFQALPGKPFKGCTGDTRCTVSGEQAQSDYDVALVHELQTNYDNAGVVIGGLLMAWNDEYWKGSESVNSCAGSQCKVEDLPTCIANTIAGTGPYVIGGAGVCALKAHISCANWNASYHDICGHWVAAFPDQYANEQWFGINNLNLCPNSPINVEGKSYRYNSITPRLAYTNIQQFWNGDLNYNMNSEASCENIELCYKCLQAENNNFNAIRSNCIRECKLPGEIINRVNNISMAINNNNPSIVIVTACLIVLCLNMLYSLFD